MAKKATARKPVAAAVLVTAMADFAALSADDRQVRFAEKAQVNRVSFSEMGKLHYLISEDIAAWNAENEKKPKKKQERKREVYPVLQARGVSPKAISNASYASRVWGSLVVPGHITEAQFDTLTFQDCLAVCRAMGKKAALQLDGPAAAELITKQPDDFDVEMNSLYEHGVTVAEKKAQDDKAAADAEAERKRQEKAKIDAAVEADRRKQAQAAAQQTPPPQASSVPPIANTETESGTGPEAETEPPTAEGGDGETETATETPPAAQTQEPVDPDANLPVMLDLLGEMISESASFTAGGQASLLAKLDEVRAAIAARLTPTNVTAIDAEHAAAA